MAEYDAISKRLIQTYPKDIVHFTLGRDDIEVRAILETEQPKVEMHRTDSLILVWIDGEEALVTRNFKPPTARIRPCRSAWQAIKSESLSSMACRSIPL